jgi:hypothetical protein
MMHFTELYWNLEVNRLCSLQLNFLYICFLSAPGILQVVRSLYMRIIKGSVVSL